jgi:hypothetical protein
MPAPLAPKGAHRSRSPTVPTYARRIYASSLRRRGRASFRGRLASWASLCLASSSAQRRLLCGFCLSGRGFASSFLRNSKRVSFFGVSGRSWNALSEPTSRRAPCSWLTVLAAKPVVDFHHLVDEHAGHTKSGPGRTPVQPGPALAPAALLFLFRLPPRPGLGLAADPPEALGGGAPLSLELAAGSPALTLMASFSLLVLPVVPRARRYWLLTGGSRIPPWTSRPWPPRPSVSNLRFGAASRESWIGRAPPWLEQIRGVPATSRDRAGGEVEEAAQAHGELQEAGEVLWSWEGWPAKGEIAGVKSGLSLIMARKAGNIEA